MIFIIYIWVGIWLTHNWVGTPKDTTDFLLWLLAPVLWPVVVGYLFIKHSNDDDDDDGDTEDGKFSLLAKWKMKNNSIMADMTKYRICTKCEIHHFENCGSCFGFGVYSVKDHPGGLFPVTASEAMVKKVYRGEVQACPECGSTTLGIPKAATTVRSSKK